MFVYTVGNKVWRFFFAVKNIKSCASKTSKSISSASKQVCKNFPTGISDKSSIIHVRSYVLRFLSMSVIIPAAIDPFCIAFVDNAEIALNTLDLKLIIVMVVVSPS